MSDSKKIDYIQEKVDSMAAAVASIDKDIALQKCALESHTQQDEKMYEELRRMNDILQLNTENLKEHMQNNMLLKDMIAKMDDRLSPIEVEHIQKTAVNKWVKVRVLYITNIGLAIAAVAGAWVYIKPWLEHLLK